ncbi:PAS domain S-box protein [Azotosporobacter soli]|uniref:PAS domain S-box protein n=1 Tax=Azotosporobacter soli TaxID=3055040 RepID=UPI0031FF074C
MKMDGWTKERGSEQEDAAGQSVDELHQSLLLLSAILESTADGLMVVDQAGFVIRCNQRFLDIWQVGEEISADGNPDRIVERVKSMVRSDKEYFPLNKEAKSGEKREKTVRLELKDGRVIERVTRPLQEADGRIVGRVGSYRDITQRVQAEAHLAEERTRFIDGPVVVFKWKAQVGWPIEYVSPNIAQVMGWDSKLFVAQEQCFRELIHPEEREAIDLEIKRYQDECELHFQQEMRLRCGSGEYRWFYACIMALCEEPTKVDHYQGYLIDINRRKEIEKDLIESEQRWQFALDGSGSGVWDWDVQSGDVFFSNAWKSVLGYQPEEMAGRVEEWKKRVHPEDWQRVQAKLEKHLAGEEAQYEAEYRLRCKDGSYKWVCNRGMVVARDASGHALRMIGTQIDFSERKKAEALLREKERNFRRFFNGIDDMVFVLREDGELQFANETALQKMGYAQNELQTLHMLNLFPPEEQERADQLFQDVMHDKQQGGQTKLINTDGHPISVECRVVRGEWSNEEVVFVICKDISELELERSKFHKAFEASSSAMAISCLGNSRYLEVNEAFCNVFGYLREEAIGRSSLDLGLITSKELRAAFVDQLEKKCSIRNQELTAYAKDGSPRYGSFSADCIDLVGEKYLLMTFVDMTEQRQVQEELREQTARLTSLLDSMPDMVFFKDLDGCYLGCNTVFAERLKMRKEEVVGLSDTETNPGKRGEVFKQQDQQVIESGKAMIFESREEASDGSSVVIETLKAPLKDQAGVIFGVVGLARDISERKATEETLRWSQSLLSQMATSSPLGFYVVNTHNDHILYFNQKFCEIWRMEELADAMSAGILRNKDLTSFCLSKVAEAEAFQMSLKRLQQEENREILEDEVVLNDGRVIRRYSTQIRDAQDHYWGRFFIYEDISRGKEAERSLLEALEFQKNMMAAATVGIAAYSWEGECLLANDAIAAIIGARRSDVLQQNFRTIESWKEFGLLALAEKTFEEGAQRQELYIVTSYGRECWLDLQTATFGSRERPLILFIANDITARKETQMELERYRTKQQAILDNLPSAAWLKDKDGYYEMVNTEHSRLCALPIDEIIGKTDFEVWRSPLAARYREEDIEVMASRQRKQVEEQLNENWYVTYKTPIFNEKGEVVGTAGLSQDISERKQYEEALREAKEAAEAANRAKSEFLANMSHEIRTPMNGIVGMTELALATQLSELQREYLDNVQHSAFALLDILNDILDFSKIEAGKLELEDIAFDWRELVEKEMTIFNLKCQEKKIELLLEIDPTLPRFVIGDPIRIRQVLVNLIGNAVKFTSRGEIIVSVKRDDAAREEAIGVLPLVFGVADTGIGIAAEKQEMIFEGFTQADGSMTRRYGGTGLGLTISRNLVKLMGGEIKVSSQSGKGSQFNVHLPLLVPEAAEREEQSKPEKELAVQRILVVDDNATNRRILKDMLEYWGMQVTLCEEGQTALALLEQGIAEGRPFELLLLDVQMPEMDGWQVAERIQQSSLSLKPEVLLLSSTFDSQQNERCRQSGVSRYLMKPVRMHELYRALAALDKNEELAKRQAQEGEARQLKWSGRVLVAEDEPVNMMIITTFLSKQGLQVTKAKNGADALVKYRQNQYDLIFMDLHMPEMDGLAATRCIRQLENGGKRVPIIALTADAMKGDREKCLAAGMDHYIAKPFRQDELQEVLQQFLQQAKGVE